MDLSPIGRAALEAREGCRLAAYKDSVGVWTIGYGHTTAAGGLTVKAGLTITQRQADDLFDVDVLKYVDPVRKALNGNACAQEQFDAFCSIAYNIGPVAFAHATFLRKFLAGDAAGCAAAILDWNKPAAIIARRQGERDQFLTPYAKALPRARRGDLWPVKAPDTGPQAVAAPPKAAVAPPKAVTPAPKAPASPRPAPTGGLSSAPSPAPAPGFWSRLHALLSRKAA